MKRKFLLSMVVLMLLTVYTSTSAYAVICAIKPVKKAMGNWCWAASAEMAGAWAKYSHDPRRTQWDIVKEIYGDYLNLTASPGEIKRACNYACHYREDFRHKDAPMSFEEINGKIDDEAKVIVANLHNVLHGGRHAVVINGSKMKTKEVYFTDPDVGEGDWISYKEFLEGTYDREGKYGWRYDMSFRY